MTSPGLGQSLIDLGETLGSGNPVDADQLRSVLTRVGQGVVRLESEVDTLRHRLDDLEITQSREKKARRYGC